MQVVNKDNMNLPDLIALRSAALMTLCSQFKVERLYVFGSVITNTFDPEKSDLDFIVELEQMSPLARGEKLIAFWEALEDLFNRKVDLLTDQPIRNPYLRANLNRTKHLIYDRASPKVSI